jgi:predicted XRE-type DNA-binding protein
MKQISETHHVDQSRISNVMHVNKKGLRILVDDNLVRQLPEGQDMIVDISEPAGSSGGTPGMNSSAIEIRLTF